MLILLPIAAFVLTFLTLLGVEDPQSAEPARLRRVALETALLVGAYAVIGSEILSQFRALSTPWVSLLWALPVVGLLLAAWRRGWLALGMAACGEGWRRPNGFEITAGAMLCVILGLLFLVAVKSPSNNNDSIHYHMARVMHWAQTGSLAHYPTAFAPQVMHPINAELLILHTKLLWGNDGLANLVQWLSLLGSLLGVSAIVALFGGHRSAQWLSVAFAASLPLGLLQATSTQNDFVTTFYFVCLLFFVFKIATTGARRLDTLWAGLALGLGLLTKDTFYPYALVPLLFLGYALFRQGPIRKALAKLAIVGLLAVVLNLGAWSRNVVSFGTPFGEGEFVSSHLGAAGGPGALVGSIARNLAQNLVTPSETANARLVAALKASIGRIDPQMRAFSLEWGWNHEDLAGNPLHLFLALVSGVLLVAFRRKLDGSYVFVYFGIILASYALMAASISFDHFGVRYQLPFFIALAPLFGIAVQTLERERLTKALTILLLLCALPWVLFNRTRPLIAMRPSHDPYTIPCLAGCTTGSILAEPPEAIMFAVWGNQRKNDYVAAMDLLKGTTCQNIGLMINSSDLEYVYWWLLDAPQSGRRIESLNPIPQLKRYLDPHFEPCAIICTECGQDQPTLLGLDLAGEFDNLKIYIQPEYRPPH